MRVLAIAIAAASVAFHVWLIFSGLLPNLVSRPLHLLLALPWIFFLDAEEDVALVVYSLADRCGSGSPALRF